VVALVAARGRRFRRISNISSSSTTATGYGDHDAALIQDFDEAAMR
jgi:hypothetical protein